MPMTSDARVQLTSRGDRELVMTRVFNAPRRLVFDAWTKPELVSRWFGAREGWNTTCEIDLRPGGNYRFVMHGPDGLVIALRGEYREVVRPERLVTAEAYEGFSEKGWRPEDATLSTMTFIEENGRTIWTVTQVYPSKEVRDAVLHDPNMQTGMNEGFRHLDDVLRTMTT